MQEEITTSVTATVDRIRFEKNGFVIFAITDQNSKKKMGAKGTIIGNAKSMVDQTVVFEGVMVPTEFGDQIDFHHCAIEEGVNYFWKAVAKVSKKAQDHIQARFGANPSWLNDDELSVVSRLVSIPGIKEKTAKKILTRWTDYQSIKQLMEIVSAYGIPQTQAVPIYRHFGEKACSIITNSPYQLTQVKGFGFKRADEIAAKVGVSEDSPERIYAAMTFAMNEAAENGSTCVTNDAFMNKLNELAAMADPEKLAINSYEDLFSFMESSANYIRNPPIRISTDMVALQTFVSMDKYILRTINQSKDKSALTISADKALQIVEGREDYNKLGEQQKTAVLSVLVNAGIVVISGYAGTGKTTTSKTALNIITDVFKLDYEDIVACALSGVAANRIKTQSGYSSGTIHSLLGTSETGEWVFNEDNKLPQSIVVLDEASMVDTHLFFSLLKAIDFNRTKLIVMGDPAQLPPVGAGQPFVDLIESKIVPNTELTKIYRQSDDKAIAVIASEIRSGKRPSILKSYSDVFSHRAKGETNQEINQSIEEQVINISFLHKTAPPSLKNVKEIIDYIYSFQVITPRRTGVLGQELLSAKVREVMLESGKATCKDTLPVSVFDKMIHLKNMTMNTEDDKEARVFNGMVGMVTKISVEDDEFTVFYPLENVYIRYAEKHLSSGVISYAWALTIHKTQGSEYQNIAIPFSRSHWNMLNNKLTYTAVTRAKNSCHLIGEVGAFNQACVNSDSIKRDTVFQQAIMQRKGA
jgi:exodeoxyribonuclease V alpha subunit